MRELISALSSSLGVASEVNSMGIPAVPFSGASIAGVGGDFHHGSAICFSGSAKALRKIFAGGPTGDQDLVKRLRRMNGTSTKSPRAAVLIGPDLSVLSGGWKP
jgi:hypothetical protein